MKKKLSEMTGAELASISDEVEREARDSSRWKETPESAAQRPAREKWLEDNTTSITIRMPNQMLELLRAAAAVEGIGYQTLLKKWVHERLLLLAKERRTKKQELAKSLRDDANETKELLAALVVRR